MTLIIMGFLMGFLLGLLYSWEVGDVAENAPPARDWRSVFRKGAKE